MIPIDNKEVGFIYKNNQNIDKVLNNGNLIFEQGFTRETSGVPPITTPTLSTGKNLKNYRIYGNSVQDGTPTPSNPVEIESVGDKSKNLFDGELVLGSLNTNGDIKSLNYRVTSNNYIEIKSDTTYTVQGKYEDTSCSAIICYYDENKQLLSRAVMTTMKSDSTAKYLRFTLYISGITERPIENYDNIQLEEGSPATDYEPFGYKIPITVSGKNLFWLKDATNVSATNQIYNCSNQTFRKEITNLVGLTNIISNAAFSQICYCEPLQSGKTYIWKFHNAKLLSTGHYLVLTYEDNTTESWHENTPITLTKNATITSLKQAYRDYSKEEVESFQIQVEEGSAATDYEPYKAPIITNIYLNEPLRKIGDYADYIDFENQKVIRNIIQQKVTQSSRVNNFYSGFTVDSIVTAKTQEIYSNIAISASSLPSAANRPYKVFLGGSKIYIGFGKTDKFPITGSDNKLPTYEEIQVFNNFVSSNEVYVMYIREVPTEEDIELPTIPSIKGTTIYSVGTNIQPSNMYIKYKGR